MTDDKYNEEVGKYLIKDLTQVGKRVRRAFPFLPLPALAIGSVFIPLYQYSAWQAWVTVQFAFFAIAVPISLASVIANNRVKVGRPLLAAFMSVTLAAITGFFAAEYRVVEAIGPGEFTNMDTGIDALYFSVTVLATVGFGDIHAQGQLAKLILTLQMAIDLVFVAVVLSVIVELASTRRDGREGEEKTGSGEDAKSNELPWPPTFDQ
ncbi:potassium channel family protein [Streptomyces sp. NPDC005236]|uniref:potassium channel family protein n=1 Tax=Streptomyces sp. NPDC005236 TaxID=3157028 RepID=UPI0033A569F1